LFRSLCFLRAFCTTAFFPSLSFCCRRSIRESVRSSWVGGCLTDRRFSGSGS
jgi:hypothetical protein